MFTVAVYTVNIYGTDFFRILTQLRQLRQRTLAGVAGGAGRSLGGGGEEEALWQIVFNVLVKRWVSLLQVGTRAPQQAVRDAEVSMRRALMGTGGEGLTCVGGGGAGGVLWEVQKFSQKSVFSGFVE
jgi:hypothetical protein